MPRTATEEVAFQATALAEAKASVTAAEKDVKSSNARLARKQGEAKLAQQAFDAACKGLTK